jgi:colanic acid/amylovoran biosynthesis glycosyltransferase
MRIAYLVNQYPTVSHTFIRREILELEQLGHVVERFSIRNTRSVLVDPIDIAESERTTNLLSITSCALATVRTAVTRPLHFLRAIKNGVSLWRRGGGGLRHLAYLAEACHLLMRLPGDIEHLHAHFGTNSTSVALLCHALDGPKFSFTVHGPEEFDRPEAISLAGKIAAAEFVVTVSSFGKSQLCRWSRFSEWAKLHVVHCGLDSEYLSAEPTPPPATATLVCVGRLCEQKGQMFLLDAARRLMAEGIRFRLLLVGDGELRGVLQSMINDSGLANCVTITGWQSGADVRRHILASRALVLPSFAEGLPVVIMESLALARPVISTYVAGIPELVLPGENGWLVPAGSVDELADAMRHALNASTDELFQMGLKGRECVQNRHSISKEAKRLAELFTAKG